MTSENLTWILCKHKSDKNCTRAFQDLRELRLHEVKVHEEAGGESSGSKFSNQVIELKKFQIQLEHYDVKDFSRILTIVSPTIGCRENLSGDTKAKLGPSRHIRDTTRSSNPGIKLKSFQHESPKCLVTVEAKAKHCPFRVSKPDQTTQLKDLQIILEKCDENDRRKHLKTIPISPTSTNDSTKPNLNLSGLCGPMVKHNRKKTIKRANEKGGKVSTPKNNKAEENPQICGHCSKTFHDHSELLNHIQVYHMKEEPSEIKIENELEISQINDIEVEQHIFKTDEDKSYKCKLCQKEFPTLKKKKNHEKWHIRYKKIIDKSLYHHCKYCDIKCFSRYELAIHERKHTGEKPFPCNHCGRTFSSVAQKNKHEVKHIKTTDAPRHRHPCRFCGRQCYSKLSLRVHERRHTGEKPFACNHCGRLFASKFYLKNHERVHLTKVTKTMIKVSLQCKYCDKILSSKRTLIIHERSHDCNNKSYVCRHCNKSFITNGTRSNHEKTHFKDRTCTFQCRFCDKKFVQKRSLTVHERSHTGERPFVCSYCGESYTSKDRMKRHEITHRIQDKISLPCRFCDMKLSAQWILEQHERRHTGEKPFVCSHCDKAYVSQSERKKHEDTHSKERKEFEHLCRFCGAKLSSKSILVAHERTHTGEKPFVCKFCGKKFTTNPMKNRHEKSHLSESAIRPNVRQTQNTNEEVITGELELDSHNDNTDHTLPPNASEPGFESNPYLRF